MHGARWVQLWRVFRAVRPDVVHLVTIKPVLLGGLYRVALDHQTVVRKPNPDFKPNA